MPQAGSGGGKYSPGTPTRASTAPCHRRPAPSGSKIGQRHGMVAGHANLPLPASPWSEHTVPAFSHPGPRGTRAVGSCPMPPIGACLVPLFQRVELSRTCSSKRSRSTVCAVSAKGAGGRGAAGFDLDAAWRLHPQVSVRPERFGAPLYHFGPPALRAGSAVDRAPPGVPYRACDENPLARITAAGS